MSGFLVMLSLLFLAVLAAMWIVWHALEAKAMCEPR